MILPDLTSPATQTVLPSNDALYGAAHVELDRLGPLVIHVPANLDRRYFSVAVMDAHFNNVARIGPRWTGNGATDHLLVPPGPTVPRRRTGCRPRPAGSGWACGSTTPARQSPTAPGPRPR